MVLKVLVPGLVAAVVALVTSAKPQGTSVGCGLIGNPTSHYITEYGSPRVWLLKHRVSPSGEKWNEVDVTACGLNVLDWAIPAYLAAAGLWGVSRLLGHRRLRNRRAAGLCLTCAYDLTGNISGICPECGTCIDQAFRVVPPELHATPEGRWTWGRVKHSSSVRALKP